jgi:hypothetical protein
MNSRPPDRPVVTDQRRMQRRPRYGAATIRSSAVTERSSQDLWIGVSRDLLIAS